MGKLTLMTTAATLLATAATAQMFGPDYGSDLDYNRFNEGLAGTGVYEVIDINDDMLLDRSEYATGVFADYDRDADRLISEEEFGMGYGRYFGEDMYDDEMFSTYDMDDSGYLETTEFGEFYGNDYADYYAGLDADDDDFLSYDEYGTGLYNAADYDQNQVITIEEEGWFEGWFDGDDLEAEIKSAGEVYAY